MKKLLTLLILTFTLIGSLTFNVFAIDVDYSFNITDNRKWNLNTGLIEDDVRYSITSKMIIKDERIDTISQSYHHVLFWNRQNQFIGYKNTQYSLYQNDKYLGNIEYGNVGFNAPENAHFYSFMIYKSGNNVLYEELNGQTLNDIFDDFNNSNLGDKENSNLNNYTINEFAEKTHVGKNLFDLNTKEYGTLSVSDGTELASLVRQRSQYIEVLSGQTYTFSTDGTTDIFLHQYINTTDFHIANTFTTAVSVGQTSATITLNANTNYIRFRNNDNQSLDSVQLELGSTATTYEFYYSGKNLLDANNFSYFNVNTLQYGTLENIIIKPNNYYTASIDNTTPLPQQMSIRYYDINNNIIGSDTIAYNQRFVSRLAPTNAYRIRVQLYNSTGQSLPNTIQLELGSTATPYEPYYDYLTKDQFKDFETIPNVNYVESDNNRLRYVMNEDVITSNNQPLYELNGLTLDDVFNTNNNVINSDFSNNTTNWIGFSSTLSVSNNILNITGTSSYPRALQTIGGPGNAQVYFVYARAKAPNNNNQSLSISFYDLGSFRGTYGSVPANNQFNIIYAKTNPITTTTNTQIALINNITTPTTDVMQVDGNAGVFVINMTELGINSLSNTQMYEYLTIYNYFKNGGTAPQSFTYGNPIYYDITYRLNTYFNGLDLTPTEFNYWLDAYERINDNNNPPINDIVSYYYIEYAKAENPTINLTDLQWYEYYNNWLTFQNGNFREIAFLNQLSLQQLFVNYNCCGGDFNYRMDMLYYKRNNELDVSSINNYYYAVGKNLFNGEWESGRFNTTTGLPEANASYIRTLNYIPIKPNTQYEISNDSGVGFGGGANRAYVFYDINKNIILPVLGSYGQFTTPNNAYYVKVSSDVSTSLQTKMQIAVGSTPTSYEAFIQPSLTINLDFLGIDNQSKEQLDLYYQQWLDNKQIQENLYLLALQSTSFNLIYPSYDYTEPAPDNFLDVDSETFLGNMLTNIGFDNDLGRIGLSLVILFVMALSLIRLNMPNSVIIGVEVLTFVGLSFLGWLPAWINIVIALGIIILLYLRFSGNGGGSNEEND